MGHQIYQNSQRNLSKGTRALLKVLSKYSACENQVLSCILWISQIMTKLPFYLKKVRCCAHPFINIYTLKYWKPYEFSIVNYSNICNIPHLNLVLDNYFQYHCRYQKCFPVNSLPLTDRCFADMIDLQALNEARQWKILWSFAL